MTSQKSPQHHSRRFPLPEAVAQFRLDEARAIRDTAKEMITNAMGRAGARASIDKNTIDKMHASVLSLGARAPEVSKAGINFSSCIVGYVDVLGSMPQQGETESWNAYRQRTSNAAIVKLDDSVANMVKAYSELCVVLEGALRY